MLNMHTIIAANTIVTATVNAVVNVVAALVKGMKHVRHLAGQYWLGQGQLEPIMCSCCECPSFDRSGDWLREDYSRSLRMSRSIRRSSR